MRKIARELAFRDEACVHKKISTGTDACTTYNYLVGVVCGSGSGTGLFLALLFILLGLGRGLSGGLHELRLTLRCVVIGPEEVDVGVRPRLATNVKLLKAIPCQLSS